MGLVSPRCQFGVDIVLACDTKSIGTLYECTPSQLFALVRNNCDGMVWKCDASFSFSISALKLVLQAKFASSNTKRKEILSKLGLESVVCDRIYHGSTTYSQSPYWKLKFFSQQFFFRFSLCRLHNALLGHVKKGLSYLGVLLGWKWCQGSIFSTFSRA